MVKKIPTFILDKSKSKAAHFQMENIRYGDKLKVTLN